MKPYRNLNRMEVDGVSIEPQSLWTLTEQGMTLFDDDQYICIANWNPDEFEEVDG